jgi:hypothetical protein
VLNTLNILLRIFGVHISHNPIPLDFGLVSEQFTKEVISETCKHAFHDLGIHKPYFCSLNSDKSFGFCWVFLPMLSFCKLLQGCSCAQSDLGGRFEISLVSFLLHEMEERHEVLHVLFPVRSVAKKTLLGFSFGHFDLNSFSRVLTSRPFLDTAYGMDGH